MSYIHEVPYNDRIEVTTPEGLALQLDLAGVGSRFLALLVDSLISVVLLGAGLLIGGVVNEWSTGFATAILVILVAVIFFGYHLILELAMSGRTPGKAACGLRVRMEDGAPMTTRACLLRNLLRMIDFLPFAYGVGVLVAIVSTKNQRLGDIAAKTVVAREPKRARKNKKKNAVSLEEVALYQDRFAELAERLKDWDISRVTRQEITSVRQFLGRRPQLRPDARVLLAEQLATPLRAKVAGPNMPTENEEFLAALEIAHRDRDH